MGIRMARRGAEAGNFVYIFERKILNSETSDT